MMRFRGMQHIRSGQGQLVLYWSQLTTVFSFLPPLPSRWQAVGSVVSMLHCLQLQSRQLPNPPQLPRAPLLLTICRSALQLSQKLLCLVAAGRSYGLTPLYTSHSQGKLLIFNRDSPLQSSLVSPPPPPPRRHFLS
jgi:hypothetical protein